MREKGEGIRRKGEGETKTRKETETENNVSAVALQKHPSPLFMHRACLAGNVSPSLLFAVALKAALSRTFSTLNMYRRRRGTMQKMP